MQSQTTKEKIKKLMDDYKDVFPLKDDIIDAIYVIKSLARIYIDDGEQNHLYATKSIANMKQTYDCLSYLRWFLDDILEGEEREDD